MKTARKYRTLSDSIDSIEVHQKFIDDFAGAVYQINGEDLKKVKGIHIILEYDT